jgi:hypothetical protein
MFYLKSITYLFFMSADQFFYLMFSTFTDREVFGLLTYYYADVLMYSLLFGMSMLALPKFSMNNCMMYRDAVLVTSAMVIHMAYVFTRNGNIIFASFGLYIIYVIMDWKNDSLTHLGMKMFGKIKDDDSFEGDYPENLKRKQIQMTSIQYDMMHEIIEKQRERFDRNMFNHEIYTKLTVSNLIRDSREYRIPKLPPDMPFTMEEQEMFERKVMYRMKLSEAIYKHIFFLRYLIYEGQQTRYNKYNDTMTFIAQMQGNAQPQFPIEMRDGNINIDKDEQNSDDEMKSQKSSKSLKSNKSNKSIKSSKSMSPGRRKSIACKIP